MVRTHTHGLGFERHRFGASCAALLVALSIAAPSLADTGKILWVPAQLTEPPAHVVGDRWRAVRIDSQMLDAAIADGTSLKLELFAGEVIEVAHRSTVHNRSGSVSWIGDTVARHAPAGSRYAPVVVVARDGVVIASIRSDDRLFLIGYAGQSPDGEPVHVLHQVNEEAAQFRDEELEMAQPSRRRVAAADETARRRSKGLAPQDDGSLHDLMVVYSQGAVDETGGVVAVENLIDLGVTETNMSYEASGVDHRLRLVHTSLTDYDESGLGCPRDLLQGTDDGVMDEVHAIRDQVAADLVMVITGNGGGCGRAFIMNEVSIAHEEFAFCSVNHVCVSPGYTFQHELGHIQSGRHQRTTPEPDSPFAFNFGFTDPDNRFRTIMAAGFAECPDGCPRRLAWSNPDVLDEESGTPMGTPETEELPTDMRKALNATGWTVANFRVSGSPIFADGFESGDLTAWASGK